MGLAAAVGMTAAGCSSCGDGSSCGDDSSCWDDSSWLQQLWGCHSVEMTVAGTAQAVSHLNRRWNSRMALDTSLISSALKPENWIHKSGWKNWKSVWSVMRQENERVDQGEGVQNSGKTSTDVRGRDMGVDEMGCRRNVNASMDVRSYIDRTGNERIRGRTKVEGISKKVQ